ncbi:DNA internalization-related competence protein ComEC/Rec2 [Vibrio sp. YMD68]|uniref:DNA internalization-related competence protein ComEC/Rec2 n=1 Tax=Vibrio sp. YMD68 TaxID=3042300 RepID=UPI00249BE050|nr:DNA internalization-related competence protein ComEC/Rec2 [Vibrio sp. YMD68]WGV99371.1 DNA internalization-related competence protein ComEC/Rec2 [Vibrio sp. YMD68]
MTLLINYWTLSSFSITVLSSPFWPSLPDWKWSIVSIMCVIASIKHRRLRPFFGISLAVFTVLIEGHQLQQHQNIIFKHGVDITINARIDSFFKQIRHGYEGTVLVSTINGQRLSFFEQPAIRLVSPAPLKLGDTLQAHVVVKPIYGRKNEHGFDMESHYLVKGWVARGTIKSDRSYVVTSQQSYRQTLYQRTLDYVDQSAVKGPIMALVFGERLFLTKTQWKNYRDSGLSHLIAISGLHIGVMFVVGFYIGKVLSRISPTLLWLPWLVGSILAIGYAWLAGFSIPTQRALAMCLTGALLLVSTNKQPLLKKLLLTMSAVLIFSPFSVLSSSFWLSFYAVAMVIYALSKPKVNRSQFLSALKVQILIVIWMVPMTAVLFSGFSASSVLYNILFIPWFSVVVIPFTFLALFFTMMDIGLAAWSWQVVEFVLMPVHWSSGYASFSWLSLSRFQVGMFVGVFTFAFIGTYLNQQARVLVGGILICAVFYEWDQPNHSNQWRVDVLDVGHGLAVLIEKEGRAVVYDTGNRWEDGSIAESLIIPTLKRRGINQLDGLILSHLDADHAGGRGELERHMLPLFKWSPQTLGGYQPCVKGMDWFWQGLKFEVLWPISQVKRAYNPHSCVIRVTDENAAFSLLLTGDIDAMVEWLLIREPKTLPSDVLIVPHHGSRTSSTSKFIENVQAKVAIASLAKGGRWNLPNESVVNRYQEHNSDWLDTGQHGQITVKVIDNMWQVSTIREREGTRWYRQMLRNGVE